jgi:hypothetical protein
MARLNATKTKTSAIALAQETTVNYEGATAFKLKAQDRLIEQVLGAFWNEDLFYTKGKTIQKQILSDIAEVAKDNPKFILQLAAFARDEIHLRTAPQVLLVEAANIDACKPFIREYTPKIVKRADELSEVVAYQLSKNNGKKNFPNSLKVGLARAFKNFDEYQLNKYDSSKSDVSIGDVIKLVHPEFNGDEAYRKALYNYLTKDEVSPELTKIYALKQLLAKDSIDDEAKDLIVKSSVTWETLISKFGSTKENWNLVCPNMGYMALLRNLRNFEEKGVDLDPILTRIQNEKEIKRSKQLPFRFYSAYKNVTNQKVKRAIAQAFEKSITNVGLEGSTAVFIDLSGSMGSLLSDKSSVQYKEVAAVLGAMATKKAEESIVIGFGNTAKIIDLNPDDTMMSNINKIITTNVGMSTNAWLAFDELGDRHVDRIVLISDMQCYDSVSGHYPGYGWGYNGARPESIADKWKKYRVKNKDSFLYSMDISAYGTKQTESKAQNVILLNGWSDKILDYMAVVEKRNVMVENIEKW